VDGWSRELKVNLPVTNVQKWKTVKNEMEALLSFLTGDYWEVNFHKSKFEYPKVPLEDQFNTTFSQVNLFSGGLDSLIGAIDFLKLNPNDKVLFASHYDSQMHGPKSDQKDLIEKLEIAYKGHFAYIPSVRVSLDNSTISKETTFRSRSILFLGIALVAAEAKKTKIVVPENGTVSLNYPLSPSRRSACSTRTTHPTFISLVRLLWSKIGIQTDISNPYEFQTKGEMVANCKNKKVLQQVVEISNSCGKRGHRAHWDKSSASHCGICMPCVYRRASLLSVKDNTTYGNDVNLLPPFTKQKGQDIGACLEYLKTNITSSDVKDELIINGLKDLSNMDNYVNVVLRTRNELKKWLKIIGNSQVKNKAGIV
jgi:7-cyano-7-deazaguanine synthase in queuosine biosynthesis